MGRPPAPAQETTLNPRLEQKTPLPLSNASANAPNAPNANRFPTSSTDPHSPSLNTLPHPLLSTARRSRLACSPASRHLVHPVQRSAVRSGPGSVCGSAPTAAAAAGGGRGARGCRRSLPPAAACTSPPRARPRWLIAVRRGGGRGVARQQRRVQVRVVRAVDCALRGRVSTASDGAAR